MDGGLVAAAGILEVDHPSFARLRGELEQKAVKHRGQIVGSRAALANLDIGDTIGALQLQGVLTIKRRVGDDGGVGMAVNLTEIAGFEIDKVDLARLGINRLPD